MSNSLPIIIIDADGLIALFNKQDSHAAEAIAILENIQTLHAKLIYPATCIAEVITTLQRKIERPDIAKKIITLLEDAEIIVEPIDDDILRQALALFNPDGSKKNTLFDAIVAAVAKKYAAQGIFSFDGWYRKQGFTLAGEMI
jgi:predicted nucleic acid-binding protein